MKKKPTTIRDLAHRLNISTSTVSRALRDVPDINPETKRAVLDLANELNFQPNVIAQSLRTNRTNTVGVVVPEIAMHFFSSAISGIQDEALKAGYNVMICQSNESQQMEKTNLKALIGSRVDGLLVSLSRETMDYSHFNLLLKNQIPVVFFDRVYEDLPVSQVMVDDHQGAFQAVEHLYANGCRRIAHLAGPQNLVISQNRLLGYIDALKKYNLDRASELVVYCKALKDSAMACTQQLLDLPNPPDAIFAVNDPVAINAIQVIRDRGMHIPRDIAIVGFCNEPISGFMEPSLTTVMQPSYEMGKVAMQLFLDQINDPDNFIPQKRVLPTKLIERNSSKKIEAFKR